MHRRRFIAVRLAVAAACLAVGAGVAPGPVRAAARGWVEVSTVVEDRLETAVVARASDDAKAQIAAPDRFEIVDCRYGGGTPVHEGRVRLEPLDADGPNHAGYVRLRYRVLVDDRPVGEARATVRGVVRGPALVATQVLRRGEAPAADGLEVVDAELTRLAEPPLRAASELGDVVPARTIGAGRVLTARLFEPRPVVLRGDTVEMAVVTGGLMVKTKGRALRDGAPGETVPAENLRTGAKLQAEVQPDGTLLLVRGPVGGRRR